MYENRYIKKILPQLNDEYDGIVVTPDNDYSDAEPFYIIWKTFSAEETIDDKSKTIAIFFDREDLEEKEEVGISEISAYDIKQYGGSPKAAAAYEIVLYISRNYRGYNLDTCDFDPIDKSILAELKDNEVIQRTLLNNVKLDNPSAPQEQPEETIPQLIKNLHSAEALQAKAVVKHMKQMSASLNLGEPVIIDCWDHDGMPYHSWYIIYYFEGFTFAWTYSGGWHNFAIYRNSPKIIRHLAYNKGKSWTMGSSPRSFATEGAYADYYRFAARVLEKVRGTWKVSLDDEE